MEQRPVFIYGLVDPESKEVRYVGKTVTPPFRLREHISIARRGGKDHRSCWIRSVLARNQQPTMAILEVATEDTWEEAERRHIASFLSRGMALTNATPGGDVGCRTLTLAEVDDLAALYESGLSMKEVGKRFHVTAATVCHILNSGNYDHITIRPKAQIRRKDDEQVMEIRRLYAQGVGLTPIAEQFALTIPMVSGIVRGDVRHDLPMVPDDPGAALRRRSSGATRSKTPLTDEQVMDVVKRACAGESQRSIAIRYGVSFKRVCKIVHGESRVAATYSAAILPKRPMRRLTPNEADEVFELRASGRTFREIGEIFGANEGSIRSIVKGINHASAGDDELRERVLDIDGRRRPRPWLRKSVCYRGHPYSPENTYTNPAGRRTCRACQRINLVAYRQRKKQRAP